MRKQCLRVVAIVAALGLTAAFTAVGAGAESETRGVSTTTAATTLLGLELGNAGSLLNLRIMGDDAKSTVDRAVSDPLAVTKLVPAELTSQVLPLLNGLTANLPKFESRTPGGQASVSGSAVDFSSVNPSTPVGALPVGLLGGALVPTSLTTALDDAGARGALDAALANLNILSGVLGVKSVGNTARAEAAYSGAQGNRSLAIDAITLLNLGELLNGLGLDLANLPIGILSNLLNSLGLTQALALPTGATSLAGAVTTIEGALAQVTTTVGGVQETLSSVVADVEPVAGIVNGLPAVVPVGLPQATQLLNTSSLLTNTVQNTLNTLLSTLTNLLGSAINLLGNMPLLKFDGAQLTALTRATNSLDTSVADVVGKVGGLSVLGIQLPGVDLIAVGELLNSISGILSGVLSIIDPSLGNLLKIGIFEKTTNVAQVNGYNRAVAAVDVLKIKVTPPTGILGLVSGLNASPAGSRATLARAGATRNELPVLGNVLGAGGLLGGLLDIGGLLGALLQGATIRVGSVQSASEFQAVVPATAPAPEPAPVVQPELPRTGGTNGGQLAAIAGVLVAFSLVTRRVLRRSAVRL